MESKKQEWPCICCTESTYKNIIAPKLLKWGYRIFYNVSIGDPDTIVINYTDTDGYVAHMRGGNIGSYGRYLCTSIHEFLEAAKTIAIERNWFKEDTPTLSEARRQFRELTQYYTVEQLSKSMPPRSWEEYLEQNPTEDTAELDKKMEALKKLIMIRDKWVEGWHYSAYEGCWVICYVHGYGGHVDYLANSRLTALSFPTKEMADEFYNVFESLINDASNLI